MSNPKIAYISFDVVPAPKGAATHIEAFAKCLGQTFGGLELLTVSPTTEIIPRQERWSSVYHTALPAVGKTLIHRVLYFQKYLRYWLAERYFQVIHIRSIYEGFPIAVNKSQYCQKLVFEVNGLPSTELKYRYPDVEDDRDLIRKLWGQEKVCLDTADLIITPSTVTNHYLRSRDVPSSKIAVIPNGVDLDHFSYSSPNETSDDLFSVIYFGTLSPWQGVDLAVRAIALGLTHFPLQLNIIGTGSKKQVAELTHLSKKLGINNSVHYSPPISQTELVQKIHCADAIVAPLRLCDRNLTQGCCPLKILEGMATGTPVIASDLPVVREIGNSEMHFLLVKPNSVESLKNAIIYLRNNPVLAQSLGKKARQHIESKYTWEQSNARLIQAYVRQSVTK